MNYITIKTFKAQVAFGLHKGYSNELIDLHSFKQELLEAQIEVKNKVEVLLSAKLRQCEILFLGQQEPSIELEFIQYPKFPKDEEILKKAILSLTEILMQKLEQNRVVIVFSDETIMLEINNEIDPNIKLQI